MPHNQISYLQEMGIQCYQLLHPERLTGIEQTTLTLPTQCKLLLIADDIPMGESAILLERVLKSIQLTLDQALHITPEQLPLLGEHQLEWIWFAGCVEQMVSVKKKLTSPALIEIGGNNDYRRALWQQICSY
ncbi:DNA polymerase III subunit psi [Vibrio sinensis]|uniref:DNA polymerase III subunit psi n=1 Tax=Vibrio sinensis TaxID=2302434 RepID=A0A3A6QJW4_9VIBR|nr:DNA polymerase III subunit psi [Vibrio sinensis]RJX70460.1 DNA polymerase III subunit psi [Vibrio sinensis]